MAKSTKAPPPRRSHMSMRFRIGLLYLGVIFCLKQIGQSRTAVCAIPIGIVFPTLRIFGKSLVTQTDFVLAGAELDDFEFAVLAELEAILDVCPVGFIDLRNVAQPFDSL